MPHGWVDTHTHLQDRRVLDAAAVWQAAQASGVTTTLLAGVDSADWQRQEALAHLPGVYFSAGLHPQRVAELTESEVEAELLALRCWLAPRRRPGPWVALGEIGMDGVGDRRGSFALQRHAFAQQLTVAQELNLPVILHILRAHEDALAVLRQVGLPKAGGVVHSYSGSKELVPRYLDLGLYLSFGGAITWAPNNRAAEALRACPMQRLLLETDTPDQTPLGQRPLPNEPRFLPEIARTAAQLLGVSEAELRAQTSASAEQLFGFAGAP
jgi:TatD DNase family protein